MFTKYDCEFSTHFFMKLIEHLSFWLLLIWTCHVVMSNVHVLVWWWRNWKKVEKTAISHEAASCIVWEIAFFSTCCRMDQFCQDPHEFLQVGEFCLVKEYFSFYMPVQMCRKKFKCWWRKTLKPILNWPELHLRE